MHARYTLAILDSDGVAQITHDSGTARAFGGWCGCGKLASREELAQQGLLAGDSLRLRVELTFAA